MHPVSRSNIAGFIIGTIEEFLGISSPSDRPRCHLKKKVLKNQSLFWESYAYMYYLPFWGFCGCMYRLSFLKFCVPSFLCKVLYVSSFLFRVLCSIFLSGDAVYIYIYMHQLSFFSGSMHVTVLTFWGFYVTAFLLGVLSLYICNVYIHMLSSFICLVLPSPSCLYQGKVTTSTFPPPLPQLF